MKVLAVVALVLLCLLAGGVGAYLQGRLLQPSAMSSTPATPAYQPAQSWSFEKAWEQDRLEKRIRDLERAEEEKRWQEQLPSRGQR